MSTSRLRSTANTLPGASSEAVEPREGVGGSSNSRSGLTGGRQPRKPGTGRTQLLALGRALEEGRVSPSECEILAGWLLLGCKTGSERTRGRRYARLRELGVGEAPAWEIAFLEVVQRWRAGDVSDEQAERLAGRILLDTVAG
jgi:hypothetical protein